MNVLLNTNICNMAGHCNVSLL